MTSETVVVELSRETARWVITESVERLGGPCDNAGCERCAPRREARAAFDAALASDSQGDEEGVCAECDHDIRPGSSHARSCSRHPINQPHSHNQPEQGGDGDWPDRSDLIRLPDEDGAVVV